ncbi:hypothetical protein SNEBB_003096 [Seison nebaliae]|nr:hypothetical protein SNEBB_003096 [Seison nebaliae]
MHFEELEKKEDALEEAEWLRYLEEIESEIGRLRGTNEKLTEKLKLRESEFPSPTGGQAGEIVRLQGQNTKYLQMIVSQEMELNILEDNLDESIKKKEKEAEELRENSIIPKMKLVIILLICILSCLIQPSLAITRSGGRRSKWKKGKREVNIMPPMGKREVYIAPPMEKRAVNIMPPMGKRDVYIAPPTGKRGVNMRKGGGRGKREG